MPMKKSPTQLAVLLAGAIAAPVFASSHMDAPLITFDPAANTIWNFLRPPAQFLAGFLTPKRSLSQH